MAILRGRDYVTPDDVLHLVKPVLGHRLIISPSARMDGQNTNLILSDVIRSVEIPGSQSRGWMKR